MNLSLSNLLIFLLILINDCFTSNITTIKQSIDNQTENTTHHHVLTSPINLSIEQTFKTKHNESHLLLTTTEPSKYEPRKFEEIFKYDIPTEYMELTTQSTIKFILTTKYSTTSRQTLAKLFKKLSTHSSSTFVTNVTINDKISQENSSLLSRKKYMKIEEVSLNQVWTLLLFFLAAFLFFICILVSALACVKNRHTIKRKSRITEMEAHLDEHYLYYPQPFLFQQLH